MDQYWILMVEEESKYKWSKFVRLRSEMASIIIERLLCMRQLNKKVRFIRCDNAGENTIIEEKLTYENIKNVKIDKMTYICKRNQKFEKPYFR